MRERLLCGGEDPGQRTNGKESMKNLYCQGHKSQERGPEDVVLQGMQPGQDLLFSTVYSAILLSGSALVFSEKRILLRNGSTFFHSLRFKLDKN